MHEKNKATRRFGIPAGGAPAAYMPENCTDYLEDGEGPALPTPKHPKYRLGELIRQKFGELGFEDGCYRLALFCGLKQPRTVREWLAIPAGSQKDITHLAVLKVLDFFDLKDEAELFTPAHKNLLNALQAQPR